LCAAAPAEVLATVDVCDVEKWTLAHLPSLLDDLSVEDEQKGIWVDTDEPTLAVSGCLYASHVGSEHYVIHEAVVTLMWRVSFV